MGCAGGPVDRDGPSPLRFTTSPDVARRHPGGSDRRRLQHRCDILAVPPSAVTREGKRNQPDNIRVKVRASVPMLTDLPAGVTVLPTKSKR